MALKASPGPNMWKTITLKPLGELLFKEEKNHTIPELIIKAEQLFNSLATQISEDRHYEYSATYRVGRNTTILGITPTYPHTWADQQSKRCTTTACNGLDKNKPCTLEERNFSFWAECILSGVGSTRIMKVTTAEYRKPHNS